MLFELYVSPFVCFTLTNADPRLITAGQRIFYKGKKGGGESASGDVNVTLWDVLLLLLSLVRHLLIALPKVSLLLLGGAAVDPIIPHVDGIVHATVGRCRSSPHHSLCFQNHACRGRSVPLWLPPFPLVLKDCSCFCQALPPWPLSFPVLSDSLVTWPAGFAVPNAIFPRLVKIICTMVKRCRCGTRRSLCSWELFVSWPLCCWKSFSSWSDGAAPPPFPVVLNVCTVIGRCRCGPFQCLWC